MKGIYFSQIEEESFGPRRKVAEQIYVMKKQGIDMELVEAPFYRSGPIRGHFLLRQLVCRLPFTYVYSKHTYQERFAQADFYYIRFLAGDRQFVRFIKKLRQGNPRAIILLELADYPTTWYMKVSKLYSVLYFPIMLKDFFAGRQYKKYINRIVIPQDIKEAYDIPVISYENGINMEGITERKPVHTDTIRIIAVAAMCNFHGYDRLIEGLHRYYRRGGTRAIELHMVGGRDKPGSELTEYIRLSKEYGLEPKVIFYGEKQGKDLDKIYDACNMAVGSLGLYRIGYHRATSLKIREYLAKGLPIISGCPVDVFQKTECPYHIDFENDSSPIDMNRVIEFYNNLHIGKTEEEINSDIRAYAWKNCDITATFKPVTDYISDRVLKHSEKISDRN